MLYRSVRRGTSQRLFEKLVAPYPHTERQRNQHNEFAKFRPHPFEERGDHREGYNTDARHEKTDEQPKSSPQRIGEQQAPHPNGRAKHVRETIIIPLPANFGVDEKTALGSKANRVTTRANALMAASQGNSNALSQTPPCSKSTGMSARAKRIAMPRAPVPIDASVVFMVLPPRLVQVGRAHYGVETLFTRSRQRSRPRFVQVLRASVSPRQLASSAC